MNIANYQSQLKIGGFAFLATLIAMGILFHSFCFFFALLIGWLALQCPGAFVRYYPTYDLRGKSVIVTGDSSGIGREFVEICKKNGANVKGVSRRSIDYPLDLSVPEDVQKLISVINDTKPELLILNAGIYGHNLTKPEDCFTMNAVNVDCNIHIFKSLKYTPDIIVVSSIMADVHIPGSDIYCASKAYITAFFTNNSITYPGKITIVSPATVSTNIFNGDLFETKSEPTAHGPFIQSAHHVALCGLKALGRFTEIHVGSPANIFHVLDRIIPRPIYSTFSGNLFSVAKKIDSYFIPSQNKK